MKHGVGGAVMLPPVFVDLVAGAWHDDGLSRAMSAALARAARVAAVLALSLFVTPAAVALPGDPGFVATSPADGAALPIDPGGIGVAYTCPVYRSYDAGGGFVVYGGPKDYGVSFASSPSLGPDGRLADPVGLDNGHAVPGEPDSCQSAMNPGGASPRPQETPGTYYWQVWRICTGCPSSYETGPVLSFTLGSSARPGVEAAGARVRRLSGDRDGERRRIGGRQRGDGRTLPGGRVVAGRRATRSSAIRPRSLSACPRAVSAFA